MKDTRVRYMSLDIQSASRKHVQAHMAQVKRTHEMMQDDVTVSIDPVRFTVLMFLTCVSVGPVAEAWPRGPATSASLTHH